VTGKTFTCFLFNLFLFLCSFAYFHFASLIHSFISSFRSLYHYISLDKLFIFTSQRSL
jgi:hypothetical protein